MLEQRGRQAKLIVPKEKPVPSMEDSLARNGHRDSFIAKESSKSFLVWEIENYMKQPLTFPPR